MAVMLAVMIGYGIQPFGDQSFIIIDGLHQYMPFYSVLYDKLKSGESLFYTFRTGLGINFLSLFSYYLSSPFNLLILLFKKTQINMVVSWIVAIKIALSGLCAAIYFGHKQEEGSPLLLVVSCAYALNSYMVGYSWNVMWLDAVMVFPIVILGIEKLIDEHDGKVYCLSLFYALYCNYYIAFMVCIFAVIWFFVYYFRYPDYARRSGGSFKKFTKQFFIKGISFAVYSLLAAGLAAVILLPAYLGIKQTAAGDTMSGLPLHSWYASFTDLMTRMFAMAEPISHDNFDGNGNLYFGIFTLVTLFLYCFNNKIPWGEKIKKIGVAALLFVSCNESVLNYIWHGFHDQYGIPNRFSFTMGFVLLMIMYDTLVHFDGLLIWQPLLCSVVVEGFLWISKSYATTPLVDLEEYIAAAVMIAVYGGVLTLALWKKQYERQVMLLFSLIAIGEMCVTAIMGFDSIGQITVSKFFSQIETMDEATASVDDGTFFRSELADGKIVDESTLYPLKAISLFGSTAKVEVTQIMDALGFFTGANEYLYEGASPVTNLLFGVKYQYLRDSDNMRTEFNFSDFYDDIDIYENPVENLSVGYLMDEEVDNWNYVSAYPFTVLNSLCETAWNTDKLFHSIEVPDPQTDGVDVERTNAGEYHFSLHEKMEDNLVFYIIVPEDADQLFLHYDGTQVENMTAIVKGTYIKDGDIDSQIIALGDAQAGDLVQITMSLKGEQEEGYIRLSLASMSTAEFMSMAENVTENALQVTEHSSNHLEGTVTADKEQYLFLSIPYDEGWKVLVDGKKAETQTIGNAFLSVIIPEGEHEVSLTFTPPGYSVGWKVSLVSLVLFLLLQIYHKKKGYLYFKDWDISEEEPMDLFDEQSGQATVEVDRYEEEKLDDSDGSDDGSGDSSGDC